MIICEVTVRLLVIVQNNLNKFREIHLTGSQVDTGRVKGGGGQNFDAIVLHIHFEFKEGKK
jgi:predicted RNA-binding protein YlqC (UPF0109 family)